MLSGEIEPRNTYMDTDISEKLQKYIQVLQFFEDNIDDDIFIYNLTTGRVYLTGKIREKFLLPLAGKADFDYDDWNAIVYPKDRGLINHCRTLLLRREIKSFNITHRLIDRDGNKVWVTVKGALREDKNYVVVVGRVSAIAQEGMVDGLTGLCSMQKFMEDMKLCVDATDGYLMVLGIDNFKNINITHGRPHGDGILRKIGDILEGHVDYPETLYRLHGDCFAVNFPQKQQNDVVVFYNSIKTALKSVCSVSAGVVAYKRSDAVASETVYQYAENALDQAKKEGKDRMIFFSVDNFQKNLEQLELLDEMRAAVHDGCKGFYLCYQPQVNPHDYSIYGVEALLRYNSVTRGTVSPAEFIPPLEQNGLICSVGEWVLKTAIFQCKEWRKHIPNFHMGVNISYVQLQQEGIADTVLNLLKEADLPGEALTLEITESMQLQDYLYFNKIFYAWKQFGIKISIDDFGTGYSSLSYLKSIAIDEVKIDRSFVNHVHYNAYNYRLLSNMIELAHSAKIKVCSEGVETTEELMVLQDLSSDILQGFLFAKPYTKEVFEEVYISKKSKAYQDRELKESNFRQMEAIGSNELLEELRKEEMGNIVEGMEESVYVSDVATYELYYMNDVGRRLTGAYDYKGRKCYEVLQGRDRPCEFCENHRLTQDEFYVWESNNTFLKRHYILKDKLIPWQGRIARLEMAMDITEKEIVSQSIQNRLNLERVIVDISKILSGEADTENATCQVLKLIGEFCKGDRSYILKRNQNEWDLDCEWCDEEKNSTGEHYPLELDAMAEENTARRIATPIMRNGQPIAFLCVDNPHCMAEEADLVKTMAGFLAYRLIQENV